MRHSIHLDPAQAVPAAQGHRAVVAYAVLVAIFQLVLLAAGLWHPVALLVPAPALLVLFLYMPRMR